MCLSAGFPSRWLVSKIVWVFWYDPSVFICSNSIRSVFTTYLVVPWALVTINLRIFKISSAFVFFFQCEDCHLIKKKHLFFHIFSVLCHFVFKFVSVLFCFPPTSKQRRHWKISHHLLVHCGKLSGSPTSCYNSWSFLHFHSLSKVFLVF